MARCWSDGWGLELKQLGFGSPAVHHHHIRCPGRRHRPQPGHNALCHNPVGTIMGYYVDSNNVHHVFVRDPDGVITTFNVSNAGTDPHQGTAPASINPAGTIAGFYVDAGDAVHSFARDRNGVITTFDVPGAGTGPHQGTIAQDINPSGTIAGNYRNATLVNHGFVRAPNGA